jgi:hypothetical protein
MRAWLAVVAGGMMLAGCEGAPKNVTADGAWLRLPAVKRQPAAAYVTIHGGPTDETLISVSCDVAIRSEMHETMRAGGVASMKPLASVPVPARQTVTFAPGGRHIMLFDVNPALTPRSAHVTQLTLTFADGKRLVVPATVVGAGDPAPGA